MALKWLMTWDMIPGREQEYFEFLVREFVPGLQRLGIEPASNIARVAEVKQSVLVSGLLHKAGTLRITHNSLTKV